MARACAIQGLSKNFAGRAAVRNVALDIEDGEFVVFLGPSGCGKTTTLRMIAGLETPDAGEIAIGGRVVSAPARNIAVPVEQRGIGMVFQSYAIWPHMTVFENVAYPLRVRRVRSGEISERVERVLGIVGLEGLSKRSVTALSGGQMQRVALARALVYDPVLLLFDEPLSNLDLKLRERLRVELKEVQRRTGLTSIYVTHDQVEAVELADRIVVMEQGSAVQIGAPSELYHRPATRFVAEFIGSANILGGRVETADGRAASIATLNGASVRATPERTVSVGERVDIVIHPEDCRLSATSGTDGLSEWPVRITERRFQGVTTRYVVDWNGTPFTVVALGTAAEVEGEMAFLRIDPQCVRVMAHEAALPQSASAS